jgi:regulator of protease activity HflC (stomatin/prohibitin superfamily)
LVLEQLLIRNINLPASVKASIESKINAEQDAKNDICASERKEAERVIERSKAADYQR